MPLFDYHQTDQVAVAAFPVGVQAYSEPEGRIGLFDSDSILFRDAHVAVIGHGELTPAFTRLGAGVRFAPIAVWDATAKVNGTVFFGAFSSLFPLADGSVVADADYKAAAGERGERRGGTGLRYDLSTRLRGKVGPVLAQVELEGRYHAIQAFDGSLSWTWEPAEMLVLRARGWTIHRTAILFFELQHAETPQDPSLLLGAMGNWNSAPASGDENVLVGPLCAWKPAAGPAVPTLYLGSQAWIESRFVSALPPFTFLAANWAR